MQLSKNGGAVSGGLRSSTSALGNENRNSSSCRSHLAAVSPARHLSWSPSSVCSLPSRSPLGLSLGSDAFLKALSQFTHITDNHAGPERQARQ